jgi:hypothetical protein
MKQTIIVVSLLVLVGVGCDRGQDRQLPDGTKVFGERTLKDGTRTARRKEFPDGQKNFNETWLTDGTATAERIEWPNGEKSFDVTWLKDDTMKQGRSEWPNGEKDFDVTVLRDGTVKEGRVELPNGKKLFGETHLPDGTQTAERLESPNGEKQFDVTWLKDGSKKVGRLESPDGEKQFDVTIAPSTVALLESDPGWIALEKKENGDDESKLREFSPEWNQIQTAIDKEVSGINDPTLRADERRRVSERLLPKAKLYQLEEEAGRLLNQQQTDYLNAHKEDYRIIASFSNEENSDASAFCFRCQYPNPVMQVKPDVEGDGVLFYGGKQGVIKDINSDTAEKWSITEKIEVQTLIRLTVHETDAVLSKFRDLKAREISQGAASLAPYSTLVASATGSAAMEDAGYQRATAEQVRATMRRSRRATGDKPSWECGTGTLFWLHKSMWARIDTQNLSAKAARFIWWTEVVERF